MRNFTWKAFYFENYIKAVFLFFCLVIISLSSFAQNQSYGLVYSQNLQGGSTIFGNTLMQVITNKKVDTIKMNDNKNTGYSSYGNDTEDMEYVDIDGKTGAGKSTRNSSSADLVLPSGTNLIKMARLYWGGRVKDSDFDLTKSANQTIKIRKGTTDAYIDVAAAAINKLLVDSTDRQYFQYQAYADITDFVKSKGAGTYMVGNVALSAGSVASGGNNGGWSIVVVYENPSLPYNSVRVYDGFQQIYTKGVAMSTTVTLTGLDVPSGNIAAGDAKMGVVAWEGDANIVGDFLKINGHTFSNQTNPRDNPWNGTITDNGVQVNTKSPNFSNQMGIDIDMFNVGEGYGISPNDQTVALQFGTEKDKYYPGVFTFTIRMKDPTLTIDNQVSGGTSNRLTESGAALTYTLRGINNGEGNANNVVIADTLPATVSYLPGSLKIINAGGLAGSALSDAAGDDLAEYVVNGNTRTIVFRLGKGANGTTGGTLAPGDTYQVQFQVTVNDPGKNNPVPPIINVAHISSTSDAGVTFVQDGISSLNAEAGPLPVTLVKFDAKKESDHTVLVSWSTSMEINCSRFVVQRSYDGAIFNDEQTVSGHGTTSTVHSYSVTDNVYMPSGTVYYRLKQIDIDGKEYFSKIVTIKFDQQAIEASISPIPFYDCITIKTSWNQNEVAHLQLFDALGKLVFTQNQAMTSGLNQFKVAGLSNLSSGSYYLQIISPNQKIIKKISR